MVISVRDSNSVDGSEPLLTASDVDTVMFRSKRNKKWYSAGDVDVFLEWVGNTLSWYENNASSSLVLAGAEPHRTIGPSISKNTIPWLQSSSADGEDTQGSSRGSVSIDVDGLIREVNSDTIIPGEDSGESITTYTTLDSDGNLVESTVAGTDDDSDSVISDSSSVTDADNAPSTVPSDLDGDETSDGDATSPSILDRVKHWFSKSSENEDSKQEPGTGITGLTVTRGDEYTDAEDTIALSEVITSVAARPSVIDSEGSPDSISVDSGDIADDNAGSEDTVHDNGDDEDYGDIDDTLHGDKRLVLTSDGLPNPFFME